MPQPDRWSSAARRPPWWPEGEPFPPRGAYWGRGGRRYMRRVMVGGIVMATLMAFGLVFVVTGLLTLLSPGYLAPHLRGFAVGVLLLVLIFGAFAGRGYRRFARPVRDIIDATARIERGDYSTRVPERGPYDVRRAARAFNEMTARLERTEAQRRSVLADVAHELRTPLSVIRGQAEGLADGIYPPDAAHVAPILEAARTMETLVEDLRTMVLSDAGALTLNREPVEPELLLSEVVRAHTAAAEARGVRLEARHQPDIKEISADPVRLRSIIGNLLSNAIRHTPAGGAVTVGARNLVDAVEITVADTGEGIPEALQPRVFDRFTKGADSPGSGLGLAIARDLVAAHGGTIRLESREDQGTLVRVTLPAEPPQL